MASLSKDIRTSPGPKNADGSYTLNVTLRRRAVWRFRLGAKVLVLALRIMPSFARQGLVAKLLEW